MRPGVTGILALAACLAVVGAAPASGQVLQPPFDGSYSMHDLGTPTGVPTPFGGLTLKAGTTDRLLIGGSANDAGGALYEIGVDRDAQGHITGFNGEATRYADAAFNDGGVAYGPDDVLFLARWPSNQLGQTKPGSTITDKLIEMTPLGVASSLAALQLVPPGQPGAGSLKLSSYGGGEWYDAAVEPDGNGTFDVVGVTQVEASTLPGGPEGFVYVAPGSPQFSGSSLLVSEYGADSVAAYDVDDDGDPIVSTRRVFVSGLVSPEGAFLDPLTGDYLFSTFGGANQVVVVRGFAPPTSIAVRTNVINDGAGGLAPGDFSVHVRDDSIDVIGSPQPGSETGAFYAVESDKTYIVSVDPVPGYTTTIGGDCQANGTVVAEEGVQPVCTITADDGPTGTLTVVNRVENDEGGLWRAEDFTIHVMAAGQDMGGSPQPGSEVGTQYLLPVGTYTVSEDAGRGYVSTIGGACADEATVTLAEGDDKTCTVTNRDVPLGPGLVIESYGPSRTDGAWGLTETLLTGTRSYLQDPESFGPSGTVPRALHVAPGIGVASTRTLAGVDVFFTGWVPTDSYTAAEKAALREFVVGGGTLIATTDDSGHTMVDAFGLTQGDGSGPIENTITEPTHPIANGPFGAVTSFTQYQATGHYPSLGPNAHEVGRNAQGTTLAVIERGALTPCSGAAIFVADVDVFSDFGGSSVNETLITNVFAFAARERAQQGALTISDVTQAEGNAGGTTFTFTVSLAAPSTDPVCVHYATADLEATAPSDYAAAAGDLTFAPGQTAKSVSITVTGDTAVEADERFVVDLSSATGARLVDSRGVGTIANDDSASQRSQQQQQLPPPVPGQQVNALPAQGTVKVKLPGTSRFVVLDDPRQVPVGTVIDTLKGRVTLVAASNRSGGTATAAFYDGVFRLAQTRDARPTTTLKLVEKLSCGGGKASSTARKKKKRRLWGDGSGKFRTDGSFSSATVRGTKWLVQDSCTSTLTKVVRGKVAVRDFGKKKTVIVKAGKQYVARRR